MCVTSNTTLCQPGAAEQAGWSSSAPEQPASAQMPAHAETPDNYQATTGQLPARTPNNYRHPRQLPAQIATNLRNSSPNTLDTIAAT